MTLIDQVTISGYRGARDVALAPGSTCVLVGESSSAERIANDTILRVAGKRRSIVLVPDFEGVTGLKARRGKPAPALKRLRGGISDAPGPLRVAVERVVAAARRPPRTTRDA